jgi:hypothetical protein
VFFFRACLYGDELLCKGAIPAIIETYSNPGWLFSIHDAAEKLALAISQQKEGDEHPRNEYITMGASINTVRTVKLLNGTQNIWASDLSDRKI